MTNLLTKARSGRARALAHLTRGDAHDPERAGRDLRFRGICREGPIPFVSRRAQMQMHDRAMAWMH